MSEKEHSTDDEYDSEVDESYADDFLPIKTANHFEPDSRRSLGVSYTFNYISEKRRYFDNPQNTIDEEYDCEVDESYGDFKIGGQRSNYSSENFYFEKKVWPDGEKNFELGDGCLYGENKSYYNPSETKRKVLGKTKSVASQESVTSAPNKDGLCTEYCSENRKTVKEEENDGITDEEECYSDTSDESTDETEDEKSDDGEEEFTLESLDLKSDRYIVVIEKKTPSLTTKPKETYCDETVEQEPSSEDAEVFEMDAKLETK